MAATMSDYHADVDEEDLYSNETVELMLDSLNWSLMENDHDNSSPLLNTAYTPSSSWTSSQGQPTLPSSSNDVHNNDVVASYAASLAFGDLTATRSAFPYTNHRGNVDDAFAALPALPVLPANSQFSSCWTTEVGNMRQMSQASVTRHSSSDFQCSVLVNGFNPGLELLQKQGRSRADSIMVDVPDWAQLDDSAQSGIMDVGNAHLHQHNMSLGVMATLSHHDQSTNMDINQQPWTGIMPCHVDVPAISLQCNTHAESSSSSIMVKTPSSSGARGRSAPGISTTAAATASPASAPPLVNSYNGKKSRKGGRSGPLSPEKKAQTARRRKEGAKKTNAGNCWICVKQKMSCEFRSGSPVCEVCLKVMARIEISLNFLIGCDTRNVQNFVIEFIPSSMQPLSDSEPVEVLVKNVSFFGHHLEVALTVGLGPSMTWAMIEFEPRDDRETRNWTLQWTDDGNGYLQRRQLRSPSLAIIPPGLLPRQIAERLERFVDDCIDKTNYLQLFGEQCFENDHVPFRTKLLKILCKFYQNMKRHGTAKAEPLVTALRLVLRMMVITYIMNHPFVLENKEQTIPELSRHNNPKDYSTWASPRIANRQLKFYFADIRWQSYKAALARIETIFRGPQHGAFLAYILMLGLASVVEECQHLLHVQADSRIFRGVADEWIANFFAHRDCKTMEEGYNHILKLFHLMYKDKNEPKAFRNIRDRLTSNPWTFESGRFVDQIEDLFAEHAEYLRGREEVGVEAIGNNNHKSRLVGRFLMSVMEAKKSTAPLPPHFIDQLASSGIQDERLPGLRGSSSVALLPSGGYYYQRMQCWMDQRLDSHRRSMVVTA